MDFKLSKTHLLQQELFRRFAENEIKPMQEELSKTKGITGLKEKAILENKERLFEIEKEKFFRDEKPVNPA